MGQRFDTGLLVLLLQRVVTVCYAPTLGSMQDAPCSDTKCDKQRIGQFYCTLATIPNLSIAHVLAIARSVPNAQDRQYGVL